jgi:hypothetical protein
VRRELQGWIGLGVFAAVYLAAGLPGLALSYLRNPPCQEKR